MTTVVPKTTCPEQAEPVPVNQGLCRAGDTEVSKERPAAGFTYPVLVLIAKDNSAPRASRGSSHEPLWT